MTSNVNAGKDGREGESRVMLLRHDFAREIS